MEDWGDIEGWPDDKTIMRYYLETIILLILIGIFIFLNK